ncbi:A/G-specific adenine glycosylase [Filimonas lacunae]|nr:A/G-specific adenine glycosylase [Filimonas lacunae]BAV09319.1 A/G-specific adenine glycosylase [Filimonas lacunae]
MMLKKKITAALMEWHNTQNNREMPWKGEKDPYKIWLSEVILQQTRVEQGRTYYENFTHKYPTIQHLAADKDENVFKLWEGLGYYNRCKNLLFTARFVTNELKGRFPDTYADIVALKGVGPYTAAAIASFAYNEPYAVVDGNVFRVLSRVFNIDTPTDSTEGKQLFTDLANEVLDKKQPGAFNQAIMDFGATICKPMAPACAVCPLQKLCEARQHGRVSMLPVKNKVLQKKTRWLTWFKLQAEGKTLVHKRSSRDIWENLHEFYLVEATEKTTWTRDLVTQWCWNQLDVKKAEVISISGVLSQQLTHQTIKAQFIEVQLPHIPPSLTEYDWLSTKEIDQLAFPRLINLWLDPKKRDSLLF